MQTGDTTAYRVQCAVLIEGDLNPKLLSTAIDRVINRHEILRTSFHRSPGMDLPLQVIAAQGTALGQVGYVFAAAFAFFPFAFSMG